MSICKRCKKLLADGEDYLCAECLEVEESPAIDCVSYVENFLPLPKNVINELDPDYPQFNSRLVSRSIIFAAMDRMVEDPYDDPCSIVLDMCIEIHNFEKRETDEERLYMYETWSSALSDLRHYLINLGYGEPPLSRY